MATFDYIQVDNGPVTLTCRSCGYRTTVQRATSVQPTVDRHRCARNTKNAAR
ncbi:hypothetical protein [Streptomyces sp. NPDC004286]|uniref:hypothetical protein n=1 Tax=Streptomyces sp. NPDC004286 TaxID=3364696 RepID=UPI00369AB987